MKQEKMIKIELPSYEKLEKIRVRLDKLRVIEYKDGRKPNLNKKTIIPLELQNHKRRKGIYVILKDNQVEYIGETDDFNRRMRAHKYLKKNPNIKYVFFLEVKDRGQRLLFEMIYKYHYFSKVKVEPFHTKSNKRLFRK